MKVTELTKEMHSKYPKVFRKALNYMFSIDAQRMWSDEPCGDFYIGELGDVVKFKIPFNMLYGLLEDFFDSIDTDLLGAYFRFHYKESLKTNKPTQELKNEAKYQAILKVSEILESQLK